MATTHPALRPVRPQDCALAVGIPLTREQFLADLARPDAKDFAAHYKATHLRARVSDDYYVRLYDDLATLFRWVCDEVERRGVTVVRATRPSDLTALLERFAVVTLATHWRFVDVTADDIEDAAGLRRALRSPQSERQELMRRAVEQIDARLVGDNDAAWPSPEELRKGLAHAIGLLAREAEDCYAASNAVSWDEADAAATPVKRDSFDARARQRRLWRLTRVAFEREYPSHIRAARAMEFSDGLHPIADVIAAVPVGFDRMLDLTICNSVIPAEEIKQERPGCLMTANRYPADGLVRFRLYGQAVALLAAHPMPYADALKQLVTRKEETLWQTCRNFFSNLRTRRTR